MSHKNARRKTPTVQARKRPASAARGIGKGRTGAFYSIWPRRRASKMDQVRGRSRRGWNRYRRIAGIGQADRRGNRPEACSGENGWGTEGQSAGLWSDASLSDLCHDRLDFDRLRNLWEKRGEIRNRSGAIVHGKFPMRAYRNSMRRNDAN